MNLDHLLVLLDEIDSVGKEEKQMLESLLEKLIENLFKLLYWELERGRDYRYWQTVVSNSRSSIQKLIEYRPCLQKHIENIYPKLYQNAVNAWQDEFYIPSNVSIELEQILENGYYG